MLRYRFATGGYRGKSRGDCLTRAVTILLDAHYPSVARYFAYLHAEHGYGRTPCADASVARRRRVADSCAPGMLFGEVQEIGLAGLGLRRAVIPGPIDRETGVTEAYERVGNCLVTMQICGQMHAVALVGGAYCDTLDDRFDDQGNERLVKEIWVRSPVVTIEAPLVLATAKRGTGEYGIEEVLDVEKSVGYDPRDTLTRWDG